MGDLSRRSILAGAAAAAAFAARPGAAFGRVTAFKQAVAEAAASDRDIAGFYQSTGYRPLWTGRSDEDARRRRELLRAVAGVADHGLPDGRYAREAIAERLRDVRSERDLGRLEVALSRLFLDYARDVQTGFLTPGAVDAGIKREVPLRSREELLRGLSRSSARGFFRALPPASREYVALMRKSSGSRRCWAAAAGGRRCARASSSAGMPEATWSRSATG